MALILSDDRNGARVVGLLNLNGKTCSAELGLWPGVSGVMVFRVVDVGQHLKLTKRFTRALASTAIVSTLVLGAWSLAPAETVAGGETRTISMFHQHTKESITITYMKDGRYVPSAMKKINYFLRDWRRNEVITIDPRSIDLVWELHADLGSRQAVHIVSGYRSPKTNAFLKRIGRNVARKSQHMKGKAIDFFFPDVKTVNIRNSALPRRVGGVGYYRSSGGPSGFLHVDSGNVRTWGPAIGKSQMASIMSSGKSTIGARFKGKRSAGMFEVAESGSADKPKSRSSILSWMRGDSQVSIVEEQVAPLEGAYTLDGGDLAAMTAEAAAFAKKPSAVFALDDAVEQVSDEESDDGTVAADADAMANMAQTAAVEELGSGEKSSKLGNAVLKPRLKPSAVMQMASAGPEVQIEPASAPPESQAFKKTPSLVADSLAALAANEPSNELYDGNEVAEFSDEPVSNIESKTSFAAELRDGTAEDAPFIAPVMASFDNGLPVSSDPSWWDRLFMSNEELLRRDGQPQMLDYETADVMPRPAVLGPDGSGVIAIGEQLIAGEGKGDSLFVNRDGKGNLETTDLRLPKPTDVSQLQ